MFLKNEYNATSMVTSLNLPRACATYIKSLIKDLDPTHLVYGPKPNNIFRD